MTALLIIMAAALLLLVMLVWTVWPVMYRALCMQIHTLSEQEIAEHLAPVASVTVSTNGHPGAGYTVDLEEDDQ